MTKLKRHLPWLLPALFAVGALSPLKAPHGGGLDVEGFGRLPVLEGGRLKPLDTIARTSLLMLRGKQSLIVDGRRMEASRWLLDVMARPEVADVYRVFVIDDPELLGLMRKDRSAGKYFAYFEIEPFAAQIRDQAARAGRLDSSQRSRFQRAVVNLEERLELYGRLKNTLQIDGTADLTAELEAFRRTIVPGLQALRDHRKSKRSDRRALEALNGYYERYRFLAGAAYFWPLPPLQGGGAAEWSPLGAGLLEWVSSGRFHPTIMTYAKLLTSYRRSDAPAFHRALDEYRAWLESTQAEALGRTDAEALFNRLQPFYQAMLVYLAAALTVFLSWLVWPESLRRSALGLLILGLLIHTAGLAFRVFLQGRPPVTNLYSSAVFVGWVAVVIGLLLELSYRNGFATVAAASTGFSTLIIAHHMAAQGDTMEMMRAVLDSNFWLTTHVVTITMGYGAGFLAALLAHIYIFRQAFFPESDKKTARSLADMTYGAVCFGLFFSFLGTVLGGIWADQSWGRFWGWDPKENGALLLILWNSIILHARWAGYIRERGLVLCGVFGGVLTSASWFGVNMLGIGLHSYGFMDQALYALAGFWASQMIVMGIGIFAVDPL